MANEEIEISELEYTEEVAPDNLIPIESATDTKATSLQVLRDWFKSFFVSKTGDETISGGKTFQTDRIVKKSTHIFSNTPTSPYYTEIRNVDTNDFEIGQFRVWKDRDGANVIDLLGRYQDSTANVFGDALGVKTYADGTSFAYTNAKDINNSILTTTGIKKSANGYVKLGNGIIIQWGIITVSTENNYKSVITFPIPFRNTNYSLNISQYTTTNKSIWSTFALLMYGNKTTTSVTTQSEKTDRIQWIAIGY